MNGNGVSPQCLSFAASSGAVLEGRRVASNGSVTWQQLDEAFPTLVRYTGLVLTVVLVGAGIAGYGINVLAPGFVAATGMILFKTVKQAANGDGGGH